ncbi:MAG: PilN domain-containing protein [Wenzhouxiangella sp.]|jgi:general secretion pathway protein L|nr:PilN domain-containing protein [Wenzhouxiangella sp.]
MVDTTRIEEITKTLRARYRASPLSAFLSWWGGELASFLPASWRSRMVAPVPRLWLLATEEQGSLEVWRGDDAPERIDIFQAGEDASLLRTRWQNHYNDFRDGPPEVILLLPPDIVLQTPVDLPLALEGNLEQALGYQLDQLTPFRADQVWHDFQILHREPDSGRLKLDLRLVPQARLDTLLARINSIGIRLHGIDSARVDPEKQDLAGTEGFNLLPEGQRQVFVNRRARLNWALGLGAVLVLVAVMAQSLWLHERSNAQLRADLDALRAEAEQVMALQRGLDDALAAANFLAEHRLGQPVMMNVIDEVTRVLPNDMWLQQMQVRDGELIMSGMANGSQRLIELVNGSYLFSETEFRGSVSIDPNSGQERFNVRATITPWGLDNAVAAGSEE